MVLICMFLMNEAEQLFTYFSAISVFFPPVNCLFIFFAHFSTRLSIFLQSFTYQENQALFLMESHFEKMSGCCKEQTDGGRHGSWWTCQGATLMFQVKEGGGQGQKCRGRDGEKWSNSGKCCNNIQYLLEVYFVLLGSVIMILYTFSHSISPTIL